VVHELHHDNFSVDTQPLLFGFGLLCGKGSTGVYHWLKRENFDSGELTSTAMPCDADATTCTFADAFANDPLAYIPRIFRELEGAVTCGSLFFLPASS